MKEFKEWLSDNLRYFMLGLAVIILLVLIFLGFRLIKNITSEPAAKTGRETETSKETESETQQETKTEKNTEKETESEKEQPTPDSRQTSETKPAETEEVQTQAPVTEAPQTEVAQTEAPQTEAPQTDPPQTEAYIPPEPVYITTNGAVYIREAPSYEGEILGVLEAGQTVEFLEDAQGWYKVNADGLIGYVGARFFY